MSLLLVCWVMELMPDEMCLTNIFQFVGEKLEDKLRLSFKVFLPKSNKTNSTLGKTKTPLKPNRSKKETKYSRNYIKYLSPRNFPIKIIILLPPLFLIHKHYFPIIFPSPFVSFLQPFDLFHLQLGLMRLTSQRTA